MTPRARVTVVLRADASPTAALHRISAVLSHQRVPVRSLSLDRAATGEWLLVTEIGPAEDSATEQLVRRLRREMLVMDASAVTPDAAMS